MVFRVTMWAPSLKQGILDKDPFQTIDEDARSAVGLLITTSAKSGGQGGEQLWLQSGGGPGLGLDYVSCSPFRAYICLYQYINKLL
jgi:hypothetical protein